MSTTGTASAASGAPGSAPLPCPYCHADAVRLIARGATFLHYHCSTCDEGWTALSTEPTRPRESRGVSSLATIALLSGVPPVR